MTISTSQSSDTAKTAKSQRKAVAKYDRQHAVKVSIKLIDSRDGDIIAHLTTKGNKQGYIKALIRKDIAAEESEE